MLNLSLEESKEVYNKDGSTNRLQITDDDFDNLDIYSSQKKAKRIIESQKNKTYKNLESSYNVLIDNKVSNEYIYSKNTRNLSKELKKVKCILSNYLKELILLGKDKEIINIKKDKHTYDAKYGFYRYKIRFSLKDKEETIYNAVLLIRNSYNGKKYLYDILDIKKEDT